MEKEEESGSLERTIWIEQCGAGRRHNEWQGGGELQSFRRKAQTQSNGHFLSSTCTVHTYTYFTGLVHKDTSMSLEAFQWS